MNVHANSVTCKNNWRHDKRGDVKFLLLDGTLMDLYLICDLDLSFVENEFNTSLISGGETTNIPKQSECCKVYSISVILLIGDGDLAF